MITGIFSGMVMQRDKENKSLIYITTDEIIENISCKAQNGTNFDVLYKDGVISGIPVGGPYDLKINDALYTDIYVGDLWILAGQSNMEGNGVLGENDFNYTPNENIRAFYMTDEWRPAKNPLHHCSIAKDLVHTEVCHAAEQRSGVGAGNALSFALKMYEYTGVPQGLIACAHGGTCLGHWNPAGKEVGGDKSLYGAMYRRFTANGSHIKGILWYQGCADGEIWAEKDFTAGTTHLFNCMRKDMGNGEILPIIQCQIGRWSDEYNQEDQEHNRCWFSIRRQQLALNDTIENIDTVASITYRTDDHVHLTSDSQWNLGVKMAEAMVNLIDPELARTIGAKPAMKVGKMFLQGEKVFQEYTDVVIEIENSNGDLVAEPRAMGFSLAKEPDVIDNMRYPYDAYVEGNRIIVRFRMNIKDLSEYYLYYGYGCNPSCNITDENKNPVPCFGPVKISEI
ncbi:MAG: sialate O-acetylesterase [Ruminococcaceae bacterium]|nr:sialate O-acetylesterase [Oscillospiraceae bacterium]